MAEQISTYGTSEQFHNVRSIKVECPELSQTNRKRTNEDNENLETSQCDDSEADHTIDIGISVDVKRVKRIDRNPET